MFREQIRRVDDSHHRRRSDDTVDLAGIDLWSTGGLSQVGQRLLKPLDFRASAQTRQPRVTVIAESLDHRVAVCKEHHPEPITLAYLFRVLGEVRSSTERRSNPERPHEPP